MMKEHSTALMYQAGDLRRYANYLVEKAKSSPDAIDNEDGKVWQEIQRTLTRIEVLMNGLRARFG